MDKNSLIYIAGHRGMVGSAIHRTLLEMGYSRFLLQTHQELDLSRQDQVESFFSQHRPDIVFLAAARVGGIVANNTYRAEFIYENLMIQTNVIHSAWKYGVKKLLFLGSSCIYPKHAPQPLREQSLLTGPLEYTNEPYAIAKIAGIKMCESYFRQYNSNFISVMPTNLYGPNDNYDLEKSHVLPALMRKMHLGKCLHNNNWEAVRKDLGKNPTGQLNGSSDKDEILAKLAEYGISLDNNKVNLALWGSGEVFREFLHVEDMARACIFITQHVQAPELYDNLNQTHLNIGTGVDLTIKDLAAVVKEITGFEGSITWDTTKPDGTPKKQLDISLLESLGWKPEINLKTGIKKVYESYIRSTK